MGSSKSKTRFSKDDKVKDDCELRGDSRVRNCEVKNNQVRNDSELKGNCELKGDQVRNDSKVKDDQVRNDCEVKNNCEVKDEAKNCEVRDASKDDDRKVERHSLYCGSSIIVKLPFQLFENYQSKEDGFFLDSKKVVSGVEIKNGEIVHNEDNLQLPVYYTRSSAVYVCSSYIVLHFTCYTRSRKYNHYLAKVYFGFEKGKTDVFNIVGDFGSAYSCRLDFVGNRLMYCVDVSPNFICVDLEEMKQVELSKGSNKDCKSLMVSNSEYERDMSYYYGIATRFSIGGSRNNEDGGEFFICIFPSSYGGSFIISYSCDENRTRFNLYSEKYSLIAFVIDLDEFDGSAYVCYDGEEKIFIIREKTIYIFDVLKGTVDSCAHSMKYGYNSLFCVLKKNRNVFRRILVDCIDIPGVLIEIVLDCLVLEQRSINAKICKTLSY